MLASISLLAVWLDPGESGVSGHAVHALVAGFALYSVAVALLVPRASLYLKRLQIVVHAVDIVVFAGFMYLTAGTTSLFVVYFVFALITATLRWQARGAVATAVATLVALLGLGILSAQQQSNSHFDLGRLIIGVVYLSVVACLLTFLGMHEAGLRRQVGQLAAWSRDGRLDDAAGAAPRMWWLAHAADTMGVRRAVVVWEDEQEPGLQIGLCEDGRVSISRTAPGEFSPLVAEGLEDEVFVCADVRGGPAAITLHGREEQLRRRCGPPLNEAFADSFHLRTVISAPVKAEEGKGRLFFLDKRGASSDDLAMASVVAGGVALIAADSSLRARLRESAAFEERIRLARDVHDGVLQSLAGTAIQLETARRLLEDDPLAARETVERVQRFLAQEQRDLRRFVDGLRPGHAAESDVTPDLGQRLLELRESVSHQWGLEVEVDLADDLEEKLGAAGAGTSDLALDIAFIVHEGLVNSARHAHASRAWASISCSGDRVVIVLGDDGHGFGFHGSFDMASLQDLGMGPVTLMQRVDSRGGTLTSDSSAEGCRIEITLPVVSSTASRGAVA